MKIPSLVPVVIVTAVALIPLSPARTGQLSDTPATPGRAASGDKPAFHPPADDTIPVGPYGDMVKLGRDIFRNPGQYAKPFVGNELRCSNCHLDAGRLAGSSPLWAAWVGFPMYRAKNHHVNTFEERLQGCFRFSMNGKAPPFGDKMLVALETYSAWLAQGAPVGQDMPGRGYPRLGQPAAPPDFARGHADYQQKCASCHGADGGGQSAAGQIVFPPLWGPNSYNWGAGMHMVDAAAAFIKANMPLGLGGTLSDQEAWDLALFVNSHERPQDPRFAGSVNDTRRLFHDSPWSMYGRAVDGHMLGSDSVPAGGSTLPQKE